MMNLERFIPEQEIWYASALEEIKSGRKRHHWMWFIFPQIKGLGQSPTSVYYSIADRAEAMAYLAHPILGLRLREITGALLETDASDAAKIFGRIDSKKLQSSMSLFYLVSGDALFQMVLDKFFDGKVDKLTVELLDSISQNKTTR